MAPLRLSAIASAAAAAAAASSVAASVTPPASPPVNLPCEPDANNTFVFSVSFESASPNGAYVVEGCEGHAPKLMIRRGVEYTFDQSERTNWMHPLGMAYYPDGANGFGGFAEVPELEEPTPDDCSSADFACDPGVGVRQAPLYCIKGECETLDDWNNGVTSGLDVYEPMFQRPLDQWEDAGALDPYPLPEGKGADGGKGEGGGKGGTSTPGSYAVKLTIPEGSKTGELFYICHVHSGMSGPIVVVDAEDGANELVMPFVPDEYYPEIDAFDATCGTSAISQYHYNAGQLCPGMEFVCSQALSGGGYDEFETCFEAIDCQMNHDMRVGYDGFNGTAPLRLFMDQMIAHHENAVSMSRIALKMLKDSQGYTDDVEILLLNIINTQNAQIMDMEAWLEENGHSPQVGTPVCEEPSTPPPLLGDINSDGRVDVVDVVTLIHQIINED